MTMQRMTEAEIKRDSQIELAAFIAVMLCLFGCLYVLLVLPIGN